MSINNIFVWEGEVRDNETDFQGIVNNANYFIYMAHARHKHLQSLGIDIGAMHLRGLDLVLVRTEIDFKDSLRGGDEFMVTSKLEAMGRIRFLFVQQVIRKNDQKIMVDAKNIGVGIDRSSGRPKVPGELKSILDSNACGKS